MDPYLEAIIVAVGICLIIWLLVNTVFAELIGRFLARLIVPGMVATVIAATDQVFHKHYPVRSKQRRSRLLRKYPGLPPLDYIHGVRPYSSSD